MKDQKWKWKWTLCFLAVAVWTGLAIQAPEWGGENVAYADSDSEDSDSGDSDRCDGKDHATTTEAARRYGLCPRTVFVVDNTFPEADANPTHFRSLGAAVQAANAEPGTDPVLVLVRPGTGTYEVDAPLRFSRPGVAAVALSCPQDEGAVTYRHPITIVSNADTPLPGDIGVIAVNASDVSFCGFTVDVGGNEFGITLHGLQVDGGIQEDDVTGEIVEGVPDDEPVIPLNRLKICDNTFKNTGFVAMVSEAAGGLIHNNRTDGGRIGAVLTGGPRSANLEIEFTANHMTRHGGIGVCIIGSLDVPFGKIVAPVPNTPRGPSSLRVLASDNTLSDNGIG
ncbi:MAG: right-handed parallel beta-helix repeat-containing protein, partial [Planctomycetota bacterium]